MRRTTQPLPHRLLSMESRKGNPNWIKGGPSPNPSGRAKAPRVDGWQSFSTGIGVRGFDKRLSAQFNYEPLPINDAAELWRGNDLAARIVETVPNEMLREGWQLTISDENARDRQDRLTARCEDLGVDDALREALCYERALGGGAILLGASDMASTIAEPLQLEKVRSLDWLTVLEPRDLTPDSHYDDPQAPRFGQPRTYRLASGSQIVHQSRLIVFPGIRTARRARGWGDSMLARCYRVLADYDMSWAAAGALVQDFSQAVFKLKGLAEVLATDKSGKFLARMQAMDAARSVLRATVIDAGEEFERKPTPIAGLPELLDRFAARLAAAADMPLTLLMGQSPGGLNATGESDVRFFYDRVAAMQRKRLLPALTTIVKLAMRADGVGEPEKWAIAFAPLWQQSDKEIAEARFVQAQADAIYISNQVLSPEEVALARFGGDEYSFDTQVDTEARSEPGGEPDTDSVSATAPPTDEEPPAP